MSQRIAFVGVGRMGANMARRLVECGQRVTAVFDRQRAAAEALAAELACAAPASLADVTASADVIFTVVSDDAAQRSLFATNGDSLLIGATGRLFVHCATLTPSVHREVERLAEAAGAASLEACMASSIPQARNGSLYLMCAGRHEAFLRAEPLLRQMSAALRYIGPTGQAAQVKALVNMVMNIHTAALAEGLGLGQALGLDLNVLREVFAQTGANSQVLKTDGEDMQHRAHDCYFSADHAAKDSGIAVQLGRDVDLKLPLAEATLAQFQRMQALGLGHLDKSGVAELTFKGRHA